MISCRACDLTYNTGGTEVLHRQTIHRGPSPSGPWETSPLGPMLFNGRDPNAPIQQTGHADLIVGPDGKWYSVFLAVRPQEPANINGTWILGRETFLSPLTWSNDGWPLANDGAEITFEMMDKSLPSEPAKDLIWRDEFNTSGLSATWEFRGTPYGSWSRIANSSLILRGTPRSLSALDGMALVTRRQDSLYHNFSSQLEFKPTLPSHEAGLVAWVNDQYHNSLSVVLCENSTTALCFKTVTIAQGDSVDGNVTTTYFTVPVDYIKNGSITARLHISASPKTYFLGHSLEDSQSVIWLTKYPSSWMAPHSGGRISWQGARIGLYATGNGVPMLQEASFGHVEAASLHRLEM